MTNLWRDCVWWNSQNSDEIVLHLFFIHCFSCLQHGHSTSVLLHHVTPVFNSESVYTSCYLIVFIKFLHVVLWYYCYTSDPLYKKYQIRWLNLWTNLMFKFKILVDLLLNDLLLHIPICVSIYFVHAWYIISLCQILWYKSAELNFFLWSHEILFLKLFITSCTPWFNDTSLECKRKVFII